MSRLHINQVEQLPSMKALSRSANNKLKQHHCEHLACYEQGDELANRGCYREALAQFDQALTTQADSVPALIYRAVMLIHLQRYEEALFSCDRALALQPDEPEAWLFRGAALQRLGRYQQAYLSYAQARGKKQRPSLIRTVVKWGIQLVKGFRGQS